MRPSKLSLSLSTLKRREQRGSRARCVLLTEGSPRRVSARLTEIANPHAVVLPSGPWAPSGFANPAELQLGRSERFLTRETRRRLQTWWLEVKPHSTTLPNWDLVSRAMVDGREGLLLVEAKAHAAELEKEAAGKRPGNATNDRRIAACLAEAARSLSRAHPGAWRFDPRGHYQMANRFAWAWKLAALGVPVVLVYLGFTGANEMRAPFLSDESWTDCVHRHAKGRIPESAWGSAIQVDGTPFIPLIRSLAIELPGVRR